MQQPKKATYMGDDENISQMGVFGIANFSLSHSVWFFSPRGYEGLSFLVEENDLLFAEQEDIFSSLGSILNQTI